MRALPSVLMRMGMILKVKVKKFKKRVHNLQESKKKTNKFKSKNFKVKNENEKVKR